MSGSRSKVRVKVIGQGQSQGQISGDQRSILGVAAKSNNHHYLSKLIVCSSVSSGRLQIICGCGQSVFFYLFKALGSLNVSEKGKKVFKASLLH